MLCYVNYPVCDSLPYRSATIARPQPLMFALSQFSGPDYLGAQNRFFASSPGPLYKNIKFSAFDKKTIFHSHANKTPFHKKGCALAIGLILNVMRVFGDGSILLVLLVSTIFTTHSDLAYHFPNPEPHRRQQDFMKQKEELASNKHHHVRGRGQIQSYGAWKGH